MHLTKLLLILLFFSLPLVHGNLLPTLGISFSLSVSGNFEFTKVMFFNILSGLIFLSFFWERLIIAFCHLHIIPLLSHLHTTPLSILSCQERGKYILQLALSPGRGKLDRGVWGFLLILFFSTLFSTSPFISLIGDTEKGHTALMYLNLLGLFFVLKQLEKSFLQKLIFTSLLAGFGVCLLALGEFFFPSFDYGELASRALGSFGHPNYLAGYLLLLLPFIFQSKTCSLFPLDLRERIQVWVTKRIQGWVIFSLFLLTLLLTKSIVALFLAVGYIFYALQFALSPRRGELERGVVGAKAELERGVAGAKAKLERGVAGTKSKLERSVWLMSLVGVFFLLSLFFLVQFFPEKLHSFLSRFYLWETTLRIIFSDPTIFFFGAGAETLPYFFDSFKVPEVYIYENFGYTADRAHNFFLDIFFQFGIFGALLFLYCIFMFFKNLKNNTSPTKISLLLFLFFGIFHYFSVTSYVIIILLLALSPQDTSLNSLMPGEKKLPFFSRLQLALSPGRGSGELRSKRVYPGVKLDRGVWGVGVNISLFLLLTLLSLSGGYFSLQLYRAELLFASGNTQKAQKIFAHPKYLIELGRYDEAQKREGLLSQSHLKEQIMTEPERQQNCDTLTGVFPSAENHFYCGNIFWKLGKEDIAKNYYRQGLTKLPDLWSSDSMYWQQYFVQNSITGQRFFSEKFSPLQVVLQKLEIPIELQK